MSNDWFEISNVRIGPFVALMSEGRPIDGDKIQVRFFVIMDSDDQRREVTREVAETLLRMRAVNQQNHTTPR
jgi:hypothetical protein